MKYLRMCIIPILILVLWEFWAVRLNNSTLVPTVEAVALRLFNPFADLLNTGSYLNHILVSATRVIFGFLLAALAGIPLGLAVGRLTVVRELFTPVIEFLRPLCPIAWIPFAMAIFKTYTVAEIFGFRYTQTIFGDLQIGMLFVIFYGGFFPVFLNTVHGVVSVKNIFIETALLLGCDRRSLFWKIILPSAAPAILTGLRIGLGTAWMVIIAAEMLPGSDAGIGYMIMYAYELAEMDILIAGMVLIGAVGALLSFGVKVLLDRFSRWTAKER